MERRVSGRRLQPRARRSLHRAPAPENRGGPAPGPRRLVAGVRVCASALASPDCWSTPMMEGLPHQLASLKHAALMLPIAALLGGALGVIRPIRRALVPRSSHVIQAQVLLAVVGAVVMIIVADSLAR